MSDVYLDFIASRAVAGSFVPAQGNALVWDYTKKYWRPGSSSGPIVFVASAEAPDSVKAAADYVCDGNSDDVDIQAAIASLPVRGGMVLLSIGRFFLSATVTINGKFGIVLAGVSWAGGVNNNSTQASYGSCLMVDSNTSITGPLISIDNSSAFCSLRDLKVDIDHTKQSGSNGHGISQAGYGTLMDRIWVEGALHSGFYFTAGANNAYANCRNLIASNNTDDGILVDAGSDYTFDRCDLYANARYGFNSTGGAVISLTDPQIFNNKVHGVNIDASTSTNRYGWHFTRGSINNNGGNGINFSGDSADGGLMSMLRVSKVSFFENSDPDCGGSFPSGSTSNTYSDLNFYNYIYDVEVEGCRFFSRSGTPTAKYLIDLSNSTHLSGFTFIRNDMRATADSANHYPGWVTAAVANPERASWRDNLGWVTQANVLSSGFAIDSTGVKTVTITHGLSMTPAVSDCAVAITKDTNVTDWANDLVLVDSTSSTTVTVKVHVSTASGTAGATAKVGLNVEVL